MPGANRIEHEKQGPTATASRLKETARTLAVTGTIPRTLLAVNADSARFAGSITIAASITFTPAPALPAGFRARKGALKMSDLLTMIAVIAAVLLPLGVAGCHDRRPVEDQGIASRSSASAAAEPTPVEATLRWVGKSGFLEIEIKNTGDRPFAFLDVQEGSACCEEFWEVEVRLASGKILKPAMFYAPVDTPRKVSIEPGKTYVREIQPGAYVQFHQPKADEVGTIIVRYQVKHADDWTSLLAAPYPTFSTKPLEGKLADYLLH